MGNCERPAAIRTSLDGPADRLVTQPCRCFVYRGVTKTGDSGGVPVTLIRVTTTENHGWNVLLEKG